MLVWSVGLATGLQFQATGRNLMVLALIEATHEWSDEYVASGILGPGLLQKVYMVV